MTEATTVSLQLGWWNKGAGMLSLAFGDSMLPSMKPLAELRIRRVPIEQIRVGDVAAYRRNGALCAHRVVRIRRSSEGIVLLTKGDNRMRCDPPFGAKGLAGVVVSVGARDLTRGRWRLIGRILAGVSYWPYAVPMWAIQRLPRGRRFAQRGLEWTQPLLLYNRWVRRWRAKLGAPRPSRSFRAKLREFQVTDVPALIKVWNRCFPQEPMNAANFLGKICRSPWFAPSRCAVAILGERIIGLVFTSERRNAQGIPLVREGGFIELLAVDPQARRQGIGSQLLEWALAELQRVGCRSTTTAPFRVSGNDHGWLSLGPTLEFFARREFVLTTAGLEFSTPAERWDRTIAPRLTVGLRQRGFDVRLAEPGDLAALEDAARRWGRPYGLTFSDRQAVEPLSSFMLAIHEGQVQGVCRGLLQRDVSAYDQTLHIWWASIDRGLGDLSFLYVDPAFRAQGLGAALMAKTTDVLIARGCREVKAWVARPGLQIRLRRWKFQCVGGVAMMAKSHGAAA